MGPETPEMARDIYKAVGRQSKILKKVEVVVCPPAIYSGLFKKLTSKNFFLGAQNVFWQNDGRFTGEISPKMLKTSGVSYCIVGHSERRALGETDDVVSKKACAALKEGLNVVICIGESERDPGGSYFEFLKNQIRESCKGIQRRHLTNLLIAYEPLWVIGKSWKEAMTPDNIRETAIFIKKILSDMFDQVSVESVPIIYGGSVEPENTSDVLKAGGVAGILVGHKSLVIEDFIKMLKSANEV